MRGPARLPSLVCPLGTDASAAARSSAFPAEVVNNDDSWSDSEDDTAAPAAAASTSSNPSSELAKATRRIRHLEEKLAALEGSAKAELELMRKTLGARLNISDEAPAPKEEKKERDDDTHYFDSYAYNGQYGRRRRRVPARAVVADPLTPPTVPPARHPRDHAEG